MNKKIFLILIATFLFVPFRPACAEVVSASDHQCFSTKWPHEWSDLKPDPRLIFGRLENGFRYVLMENKEPRNRVGMYLDVLTGSLNEKENQRGIAHFLEHMVFNGSTHFKPGSLIEYFQSLGMSFGGDTNARTGYQNTVYNLILPNGTKDEIEKGLLVFSDFARGALLLDSEINRERGVILSEKRSRDSASFRAWVAANAFELEGTRADDRLPIGDQAVIEKADHSLLESYYDAWYRPENMILVMVGDFNPKEIEPLIKERFLSMKGVGTEPLCHEFGHLKHTGIESFYHYEPELGTTKITIKTLWDKATENDSFNLQVHELKMILASMMIAHRLDKAEENPKTPITNGQYSMGNLFDRVGYGSLSATAVPQKWREALQFLDITLRRALKYGFTDDEFQRAKRELVASIDSSIETRPTRNSMTLAGEILSNLNNNRVFQSPEQVKELYLPIVQKMTLQEVQQSLSSVWGHPVRLVEVSGNLKIDQEQAEALINNAYSKSEQEPIAARKEARKLAFPYLKPPLKAAKPRKVEHLPGIDADRLIFANGVVLYLKKTDFKKDSVEIRIDFGHGKQSEPAPGMSVLAQSVVNDSGSGKLTESELADVLAGSTVNVNFQVNESSFSWVGDSLTQDTEKMIQVLQTMLVDPGIRQDAYTVSMENFKQMYKGLETDVNGGMVLHVKSFLEGGNPHAGMPSWQNFSRLSFAQMKEWVSLEIAHGPPEISVVGDFDRKKMTELIGRYFGGLPKRNQMPGAKPKTISFPKGKSLTVPVDSSIEKAMLVVAWPTSDFWNIGRTRRLNILAEIFSDRLRKKVREELGAAYSPVVLSSASRVFPGYGVLEAVITVDPRSLESVKNVVFKIAEDLQKHGCTADELERAKIPMLTSIKDVIRTNAYWLNTVLALSDEHPQQLEWPKTLVKDYESITTQEINALAGNYMKSKNAAVATITPGKLQRN